MSGVYGEAAAELMGEVVTVLSCGSSGMAYGSQHLSIWRFLGKAILYPVRYSAQGQDIRTGEDGLWLDETDQPPLTPSTMACCR